MGILHPATLTPTKAEILARWLPAQSWTAAAEATIEVAGSYRFDDPEGAVGMEGHLVRANGKLLHVPLTYRDAPLEAADEHLVGTMEHSVLGTRWVYDALAEPLFIRMLAAATITGVGQSVGLVEYKGRWLAVPAAVRLEGGGGGPDPVPVDGFVPEGGGDDRVTMRNDRLELRIARRPIEGARPPIGLTATWAGQKKTVVLAEVRDRASS
jgi:hypothetical protein